MGPALLLRQGTKRAFDLVVSGTGLVLAAPVLVALCLAIQLDSPGPAIFRQRRVGWRGRAFTCLKLRTMESDASDDLHRLAFRRFSRGEPLSEDPAAAYKLTADPRVTRLGRWLRALSLDELPQLLNVWRGEMSIVGPRPAIPYELEFYQPWHHERHEVRPGMTGLWQVSGRGRVDLDEMLRMDVEYARSWNLWTDLRIVLLTIPAVLARRGAR
jgi:lipopolysaccharide/colanic/teichoic acid biosynthesis glycosyltransferase